MTRGAAKVLLACGLLTATGCSGSADEPDTTSSVAVTEAANAAPPTVPVATDAAAAPEAVGAVPSCADVPDNTDSLDFSGAQYSEFPDRAQTAAAIDFAITRGQYLATWTRDRHETWTIVGVTSEMAELQAELDAAYPRARVLFMNIEWTPETLSTLADDVARTLGIDRSLVSWSIATGRVAVDADAVDDAGVELLQSYASLPVCVA